MKKCNKLLALVLIAFWVVSLCGCDKGDVVKNNEDTPTASTSADSDVSSELQEDVNSSFSGEVVVSVEYEKQSGHASNQFAVWIED